MLDAYGIPIATTAGRVKITVFTANGTYQQSSQLLYAWIRVVGGGGGGANPGTTPNNAGGGGSGGYAEKWLLASQIGQPITVTIGAGGAVGNNAGGASSFAAISGTITANGGSGGTTTSGGAGGTTTGGDLNLTGGTGILGGTGTTGIGGSNPLGPSNSLYGGGGVGSDTITPTAGSAGIVIVTEFLGS